MSAPPRDFAVLLPPGWVRIPLDGSENARMAAVVAAKAAEVPEPQRGQVRQRLLRVLNDMLGHAKSAGGIDVLVSLGEIRGVPISASCLVSYLDQGKEVPLDGLRAELAAGDGEVTWAEIAGSPAIRRQRTRDAVTAVDFFTPVPGRPGLLSLSFGTAAAEPLAGALLLLFERGRGVTTVARMTDFALPPVIVDHDANWIEVDLDGDLGDWTRRTARDIMSRMPGHHGRRTEKHMVSVLEDAGTVARRSPGTSMALLLAPDVNDTIKALVQFCPVDLAGRDEDDAWAELLSALSADDSADVTEIATGAGPCRRIRQRYAAGERGPERPVGEHINYVWMLPRWGAAVVMTTAFEDLLEAGRWRGALDKLAAGVGLEPETGSAHQAWPG